MNSYEPIIIEVKMPEGDIISWVYDKKWDGPIDYYIQNEDYRVYQGVSEIEE